MYRLAPINDKNYCYNVDATIYMCVIDVWLTCYESCVRNLVRFL